MFKRHFFFYSSAFLPRSFISLGLVLFCCYISSSKLNYDCPRSVIAVIATTADEVIEWLHRKGRAQKIPFDRCSWFINEQCQGVLLFNFTSLKQKSGEGQSILTKQWFLKKFDKWAHQGFLLFSIGEKRVLE